MIDSVRTGPDDASSLTDAELEALEEAIARLSAHLAAATYRLLVWIRAFDAAGGWQRAGSTSCAKWLSWRTGIGPGAARERVRVARALGALPVLSRAMERGEVSYSVARALTRVATPENEAELVECARHGTAAEMERLVRAWRNADRAEAALGAREAERARHAARQLWLIRDETDGSWRLPGRIDPEVGALLERALEAAGELLYRREEETDGEDTDAVPDPTPPEVRRADALGLVAEAALGGGLGSLGAESGNDAPVTGSADRFQVVVRVPAETLAGFEAGEDVSAETPHLESGPPLVAATARRLGCDASMVGVVENAEGHVLDVGRKRRTVPSALRRALDHRDGGCVFPGCGVTHCDAHHMVPWAEGGGTNLDNLALLCRRHHRLVHEDGWTVGWIGDEGEDGEEAGAGRRELRFTRPDGRPLPRVPDPVALEEDALRALVRTHRDRGLGSGPWTATPDWDGVAMDVDWALGVLRGDGWPEGKTAEVGGPYREHGAREEVGDVPAGTPRRTSPRKRPGARESKSIRPGPGSGPR